MSIDDATAADWDMACKHVNKASKEKRFDVVDKPAHYNNDSIEAIDYIKQQLGDGFEDYCEGNVFKYLHRWKYKNGVEDLRKARWYLDKLIKETTDGIR